MDVLAEKTFETGAWNCCGGMKLTTCCWCWLVASFCADAEAAKVPRSANSAGAVGVMSPWVYRCDAVVIDAIWLCILLKWLMF